MPAGAGLPTAPQHRNTPGLNLGEAEDGSPRRWQVCQYVTGSHPPLSYFYPRQFPGLAGELARVEIGERGMTAGDVLAYLPPAWRTILRLS